MNWSIVPATQAHAIELAKNMRPEDVAEIAASSGRSPLEALMGGLHESEIVSTGLGDKGQPGVMFGLVKSPHPAVGVIWLLGSSDILKYRKTFVRESSRIINEWHQRYPVLWNMVDKRNTVHIHWLARIGCQFINEHPEYGVARLPFLEFIHV